MKHVFRLLLALTLLCTVSPRLQAQEGDGIIQYFYDSDEDAYTAYVVGNGDVVIPEVYNGRPVRYFGGAVSEGLTSLTLPTSIGAIRKVGDSQMADINTPALKTLDLSATSLRSLGDLRFSDCSALTSLLFPPSIEDVSSLAKPNTKFFAALKKLSIPPRVRELNSVFLNLEELIVEDGDDEFTMDISVSNLKKVYFGRNGFTNEYPGNYMQGLYFARNLEELTIGEMVTYIPSKAFTGSTSLKKVVLPSSLKYIGDYAFSEVTGLREIELRDVDYLGECAFSRCPNLESVTFDGDFKSVGSSCFKECPKLSKVTTTDKVSALGESMFIDCAALTSINLSARLKEIPNSIFERTGLTEITIPSSVTAIGDGAFSEAPLSKLTIPGTVETLGHQDYMNCDLVVEAGADSLSVGRLDFGSNTVWLHRPIGGGIIKATNLQVCEGCDEMSMSYEVDNVYAPSFEHWAGMKFKSELDNPLCKGNTLLFVDGLVVSRPVLPAGLKRLNNYVFFGYKPLVSVTFPEGFESIGSGVFANCTGLQRLIFHSLKDYLNITPDDGSAWSKADKYSYYPNIERYIGGQKLVGMTSIDIPEGITAIPREAFFQCNLLQYVTIPSSVVSIGEYAFDGTEALTSVGTLSDDITKIGEGAFRGSGIKSINIPKSITEIEYKMCSECKNLVSVKFHDNIESIGASAFNDVPFHDQGPYSDMVVDIYLPRKLKFIGNAALAAPKGTYSRRFHVYPELEYVENYGFLGDVYIEDLKAWCHINFQESFINPVQGHDLYLNGQLLTGLNVPDEWEYISDGAFYSCRSLRTVRLGSVKAGENTFWNCNLSDVCVDNAVLGPNTFPKNVKNIYSLSPEPPVAVKNSFSTFDEIATLYVPEGFRQAYENSMPCWWQFLNIKESDFAGLDDIFGAQSGVESVAIPEREWTVTSQGGRIFIDGAPADSMAQVYSMAGTMFYSGSADIAVDVAPGMYVVRLSDGTSVKITVK